LFGVEGGEKALGTTESENQRKIREGIQGKPVGPQSFLSDEESRAKAKAEGMTAANQYAVVMTDAVYGKEPTSKAIRESIDTGRYSGTYSTSIQDEPFGQMTKVGQAKLDQFIDGVSRVSTIEDTKFEQKGVNLQTPNVVIEAQNVVSEKPVGMLSLEAGSGVSKTINLAKDEVESIKEKTD